METELMAGESVARDALAGAVAGCVATVVMTTWMEPGLAGRLPPDWRPREFVPKQVVRWLRSTAGINRPRRGTRRESVAAGVAHLGYGAAAGAVYGVARGRLRRRLSSSGSRPFGAAFGVALWAAGYQGWMPLLGVRPPTTAHPLKQWPTPIANHALFGTVVADLFDRARGHDLAGGAAGKT